MNKLNSNELGMVYAIYELVENNKNKYKWYKLLYENDKYCSDKKVRDKNVKDWAVKLHLKEDSYFKDNYSERKKGLDKLRETIGKYRNRIQGKNVTQGNGRKDFGENIKLEEFFLKDIKSGDMILNLTDEQYKSPKGKKLIEMLLDTYPSPCLFSTNWYNSLSQWNGEKMKKYFGGVHKRIVYVPGDGYFYIKSLPYTVDEYQEEIDKYIKKYCIGNMVPMEQIEDARIVKFSMHSCDEGNNKTVNGSKVLYGYYDVELKVNVEQKHFKLKAPKYRGKITVYKDSINSDENDYFIFPFTVSKSDHEGYGNRRKDIDTMQRFWGKLCEECIYFDEDENIEETDLAVVYEYDDNKYVFVMTDKTVANAKIVKEFSMKI